MDYDYFCLACGVMLASDELKFAEEEDADGDIPAVCPDCDSRNLISTEG